MKFRFLFLVIVCATLISFAAVNVAAKDTWINVKSKNFFLVGNASEKEIRQVATKLEQFRETFRKLFPTANFSGSTDTNVVVFKNSSAYRPFKPKRADGKPDDGIAGYFQPGEDVNYITLSTGGEKEDVYGTIFHEYVHSILELTYGKTDLPPWFNEGLAEYYQTFKIEEDQKVTLGSIQEQHLNFLAQNQLIPLRTFFEIDNYSLHENGNHSRSIFYAQAWALIHYLLQSGKGANVEALGKFLNLVISNVQPEEAFKQAFKTDYATMEKALKNYVSLNRYSISIVTFKEKLVFDNQMTARVLSEGEANAYLGDLLYHLSQYQEAEVYLQKAIATESNSSLANTSLGLVKMRQRKFDEAKKHLEVVISGDARNHIAHYKYAEILSRESMDEFGFVRQFPVEIAEKMRRSLKRAIELSPDFIESYRLLAFVNLVNEEMLDESLEYLRKALKLQPGNQSCIYIAAQIYLRQEKLVEAKRLAERLYKTADEAEIRANAQSLLATIGQYEERKKFNDDQGKVVENEGFNRPVLVRKDAKKRLTPAEIAKIEVENENIQLNKSLARPKEGELQVAGTIEKVACVKGEILYTIKTASELLLLSTKDFSALELVSLSTEAENMKFGCDANVREFAAVLTYKPATDPKAKSRGQLLAITFVPKIFRLKTEKELSEAQLVFVEQDTVDVSENNGNNGNSGTIETSETAEMQRKREEEFDNRRREAMLENIRDNLRKPLDGEKREIGTVDRIECGGGGVFFVVLLNGQSMKLKSKTPNDVKFSSFTPDASGIQLGCGTKLPPVPAIVTYRPKSKDGGEIVAIEFVPKSFKLEQ